MENQVEKIEKKNELLGKLLKAVFHDIRNPLHNLLAFVDMFMNASDEEERKEIMDGMTRSGKALAGLLDNFSLWSGELMNDSKEFSEVVLDSVVQKILALFSQQIAKKKVDVGIMFRDVRFISHERTVFFVVGNIIYNAIKFSKEGGAILIYASELKEKTRILISDSGVGMSKEQIPELFTEGNTTPGTNGESGTGLGLSLAKSFLEEIGGTISVESTLGKGASFTIDFPKQVF